MAAEVKINSKRLEKALRAAPRELYKSLKAAGHRVGSRYLSHHRTQRMRATKTKQGEMRGKGVRGSTRGAAGRPGLKRQFSVAVSGATLNSLTVKMFTRSFIAKQHEYGQTVFARNGKYLAIPMPAARDAKGRVTRTARNLLAKRKLFLLRRADNKAFLVYYKKGKGGKELVFMYHLAAKAQLQPRLGFRQEWKPYRDKVIREYNRAVGRALKAARGRA